MQKKKKDWETLRDTGMLGAYQPEEVSLQELPSGTRLRVLAEQGGWLHVAVADGPMDWLALTAGLEDGYVKAADVLIAATEAQLDWLE